MSSSAPATAATRALDAAGVAYRPRPYPHDTHSRDYGAEAAAALGVPPQLVFKTLVVVADDRLVIAVVPVSGTLDLKALAAAVGAKRAVMAEPALAERRTGYVVGGISPFGRRTPAPLVLDTSAEGLPAVLVSGGRRGFDLEVAPADLLRATGGSLAPIGAPR